MSNESDPLLVTHFTRYSMSRPHLPVDRNHSLSGRDTLDWFFANRRWIRLGQNSTIECAWAKRSLPEGESATRFLLLAPKRSYKHAHDRNKIKRWLRAAIAEVPEFSSLETELSLRSEQLLVMMRVSKPIREVKWAQILVETGRMCDLLKKRV
jgi:RNase P protein component